MVESAGPGTRPRSGGPRAALPLSAIIGAQIVAIALYAALRLNGTAQMQSTIIAVAVGIIGALLAISTSSLISVWGRVGRRFGFVRRRFGHTEDPPMPFDVPMSDGSLMGLRWVDGRLISIVRLARPITPTILTPTQSVVGDDGLKLGTIARALSQFDIELEAIDVVAHGWRARGASHLTAPYYTLTGSLPAVPQQEVWVVLRLNPLLCPDAIASRGGGPTGVIRTAITATRRVGNHLAREGYRTRILTASDITGMGSRLLDGAAIDSAQESWTDVRYGSYKTVAYAVPGALDEKILTDIWSTTALSTTTSMTITRAPGAAFSVATVVRYGSLSEIQLTIPDGLQLLAGQQRPAVEWTIPAQRSPIRRLPVDVGDLATLDATVVPDGGSGQVLGADHTGAAVSVGLFGPDVRRVDVYGQAYLALQIAVRSVALGARILVRTDRPEVWRPLFDGVNDPRTLYVSTNPTDQRYPTNTYTVCILDSREAIEDQTISTHIRIHREAGQVDSLNESADVAIYQDASTNNRVYLVTTFGALALSLVSVPAENNLLEGARQARPNEAPQRAPQRTAPQSALVGSPSPTSTPDNRRPGPPPVSGPGRPAGPGGPGPGGPGAGGQRPPLQGRPYDGPPGYQGGPTGLSPRPRPGLSTPGPAGPSAPPNTPGRHSEPGNGRHSQPRHD